MQRLRHPMRCHSGCNADRSPSYYAYLGKLEIVFAADCLRKLVESRGSHSCENTRELPIACASRKYFPDPARRCPPTAHEQPHHPALLGTSPGAGLGAHCKKKKKKKKKKGGGESRLLWRRSSSNSCDLLALPVRPAGQSGSNLEQFPERMPAISALLKPLGRCAARFFVTAIRSTT